MKSIYTALNEATARLGIVISIAGAIAADECLSNDLSDFLLEQTFEDIEACIGELPEELKEVLDDRNVRADEFSTWAIQNNKLGFIVEVQTPDMSRDFFSWGMYFSTWVYGDSFEEAVQKGLEWVASVRANEQAAKAAPEGGA